MSAKSRPKSLSDDSTNPTATPSRSKKVVMPDGLLTGLAVEETDLLKLRTKVDVNELFCYADAIESQFYGGTDHLTAKDAVAAGDVDR